MNLKGRLVAAPVKRPLRPASVDLGHVTREELRLLLAGKHASSRVVTLVPVDTAAVAAKFVGKTPTTVALLRALGEALPEEWRHSEDEEEDDDEDEEDDDDEDEKDSIEF